MKVWFLYNKESLKYETESILVINYTNTNDIKIACLEVSSLDSRLIKNLSSIQNNQSNETNETNRNYVIVINSNLKQPINIIKYN